MWQPMQRHCKIIDPESDYNSHYFYVHHLKDDKYEAVNQGLVFNLNQLEFLDNVQNEDIKGVKYDQGKLRYDLIPPKALEGIADVLTYGANKYGDRNWEKGIDFNRLYAAHCRHVESYRQGEILCPESTKNHLLHAIVNLVMAYELSLKDANK